MRKIIITLSVTCWLLVLCGQTVQLSGVDKNEPPVHRILVISSYNFKHAWSKSVYNAIFERFALSPRNYKVDIFELSAVSASPEEMRQKSVGYLELIKNKHYDMVVAVLDDAFELILSNYADIPRSIPIVFSGYYEFNPQFQAEYPNIAGVGGKYTVLENVRLGLKLMPETQEIAIVSDTASAVFPMDRELKEIFRDFKDCQITLLDGKNYNTRQMLDYVGRMPENSFVILCPWRRYEQDGYVSFDEVAFQLERRTKRPYLVTTETLLGFGALGGYVSDGNIHGGRTADMMEMIFFSTEKNNVPVLTQLAVCKIDVNVMQKFALDFALLPDNIVEVGGECSFFNWNGISVFLFLLFGGIVMTLLGVIGWLCWRDRRLRLRYKEIHQLLPVRVVVVDRNNKLLFLHVESALVKDIKNAKYLNDLSMDIPVLTKLLGDVRKNGRKQRIHYSFRERLRRAEFRKIRSSVFGKDAVLWFSYDVTEEIKVNQRESENRLLLDAILDDLPGCVSVKDVEDDFKYIIWNKMLEQITEIPASFAIGRGVMEVALDREAAGNECENDRIVAQTGKVMTKVESYTNKSGVNFIFRTLKTSLKIGGRLLLIDFSIDITRQHELECRLRENVKKLNVHVENEHFVNDFLRNIMQESDFTKGINTLLSEIGNRLHADRCVICRYSEDQKFSDSVFEWCASDCDQDRKRFRRIDVAKHPGWIQRLLTRKDIELSSLHAPMYLVSAFNELRGNGVLSTYASGIWIGEKLYGFLTLEYIREPRELSESELQLLHDGCAIYGLAHERSIQLADIEAGIFLQSQIFDQLDIPIAMFNGNRELVSVNNSYCRAWNVKRDEVLGLYCGTKLCKNSGNPEQCRVGVCPMWSALELQKEYVVPLQEIGGRQYQISCKPLFERDGKLEYILNSAVDISELVTQRRQLEVNNLLLSRAGEMAKVTYYRGDRTGGFVIMGGSCVGFAIDEGIHAFADWIENDDYLLFRAALERLVDGEINISDVVCRASVNGEVRNFRMLGAFNHPDDEYYFGVCQDITATIVAEKAQRKWIEVLNNYVDNEKAINRCLAKVVREVDSDKNINEILGIMGKQLRGDFARMGTFSEGGTRYEKKYQWVGELDRKIPADGKLRSFRAFSDYYDSFNCDELLIVSNGADSGRWKEDGFTQKLRSGIAASVWVGGVLFGVISVEFLSDNKEFSEIDEKLLRSASKIISLVYEHLEQNQKMVRLEQERQIIFDNVTVPIIFFDKEGNIVSANPAAIKMSNTDEEHVLKNPCYTSFCMQQGIPDCCPMNKTLKSGKPHSCEFVFNGRDYTIFANAIYDASGDVINVIESGIDMTEINMSRHKLEIAVQAAQAADRAKSYFLATMSHELRTPLNAVIGFSELLRSGDVSAEIQSGYIDAINSAGNTLLGLINDVLNLSKIEAEQAVIQQEECDLSEMLDDIDAIFMRKAKERSIAFRVNYSANLPHFYLDAIRVKQILLNLIGNAIKFTHSGGVDVSVSFNEVEKELNFEVKDTGIGIKKNFIDKVFQPFTQQDAIRGNRKYEGAGLGMAISHKLAVQLGGDIYCSSEEGHGSVFVFVLKRVMVIYGGTHEKRRARKALLVDYAPLNIRVSEYMFRKQGIETVSAGSGAEALKALESYDFDILATGIWMPDMNGAELATEARKQKKQKRMRIVAVTADADVKNNFATENFDEILYKPLTLDKIKKLLSQ